MSDIEAVLFANEAFYLAFNNRDFEAMAEVWAKAEPLACIHPGWPALTGRQQVLESWRGILANPQSPTIRCRGARALLLGELALVLCYEDLSGAVLAASNLFRRQGRTWGLIHHQASPCHASPPDAPEPPKGRLQ